MKLIELEKQILELKINMKNLEQYDAVLNRYNQKLDEIIEIFERG